MFFGAMGATPSSRTRFFRAKALAERAVMDSPLDATVLSPSIVYAPGRPVDDAAAAACPCCP